MDIVPENLAPEKKGIACYMLTSYKFSSSVFQVNNSCDLIIAQK